MIQLGLSKTQVSGAVAAAFVSVSIAIISLGILTYVRKMEPFKIWLVPYVPSSQYGGIFLYSNVIWGIIWIGLFFVLKRKQNAGNLRTYVVFFLISLALGTGFVEASLNWSQLSTVMQLGNVGATVESGSLKQTNTITVKILTGSSIQGNASFDKEPILVGKDNTITWINDDVAPHTITSGTGIDDPQLGKLFDSGSIGQGQKFSLSVKNIDTDIDYYCVIHPFMKGKIIIQ